ncbi:MAG: hypothetical protein H7Z37_00705 [Pyrinomonadaceae bacterium]|nr:hypothetical protein [Pyrinomonadaceae bacterium]
MRCAIISAILICFAAFSGCQKFPVNVTTATSTPETVSNENDATPFATKEPEKYTAKIVFAFKFEEGATNFVEQIYTVARDGANRKLDFETDGKTISRLETADGKTFTLLPKEKVAAETTSQNNQNEDSDEFSLAHLLHTKPEGAKFERIGNEEINGAQTTKYKLDYGKVTEAENARTETTIWVDEKIGLPVKTEVIAYVDDKPNGAKSTMELREIKTDVDANVFVIPKDYRKVSSAELQILMGKN